MSFAGLGPDFAGPGLGSQISARNAVVGSRIVGSQPFARTNNVHLPGMARGRRSALQTANFMALQTRVEAQQTPSSLERWPAGPGSCRPGMQTLGWRVVSVSEGCKVFGHGTWGLPCDRSGLLSDHHEKWESSSGRGLPEELVLLQDPTVQVRMPPPGSVDPFSLDDASLDQLITVLGNNSLTWRRALLVYEWLLAINHVPDSRFCTTLMRVCTQNGQPLRALDIYEWMRSDEHVEEGSSHVPSVHTYTVAIRAASAANLLDRAWRIWNEAKASGVDADSRLCCSFIEVLSKQGRTDEALRIFTQMLAAPRGSSRAPSVHAFTTAMRAATSGGRWETALEIWGHMHQHNVKPTGHAYAAAISACAAGSDCKRAMALFKEMLRINIRPDVVLCTALITALASNGLARDACRMVAWMKDNGLAPNVRTYTALLTAYGNACMFNEAVDLVLSMQAGRLGNVQPNAYTYSVLFKALGENGQWQLAEAVFSQLESEALKDMGIPVTPIMQQAPKPAPPQPRPSHSPETSSRHADATMQGHRSVENGALLLSESSSSSGRRLGASGSGMVKSRSHSSLSDLPRNGGLSVVSAEDSSSSGDSSRHGVHATGSWTSPSQLNGLDLGAIESDPTPSLPLILSSLMLSGSSSFFSTDSLYAADAAADAAAPPQPPPTPSPPAGEAARLQAAAEEDAEAAERARQGKELLSLLLAPAPVPHRRRHRHADVINQVVCGALMLAYERAHLWGQAVAVISRARRLGVKPNTIMFNTAISAAGRASQLQVAAELFRQVEEPDCVTFETLLTAYGNVGDVDHAEEVFGSMVEVGFKPRDYAFCGLITAYTQAKDFARAMAVRQRMLQMQVPLTVHVYNCLLVACTENYEYEKALEVYGQLRQDGVQPNALTQNIMETTKTMGIRNVEKQQVAAAAMSAAVAAAGAVMARMGAF